MNDIRQKIRKMLREEIQAVAAAQLAEDKDAGDLSVRGSLSRVPQSSSAPDRKFGQRSIAQSETGGMSSQVQQALTTVSWMTPRLMQLLQRSVAKDLDPRTTGRLTDPEQKLVDKVLDTLETSVPDLKTTDYRLALDSLNTALKRSIQEHRHISESLDGTTTGKPFWQCYRCHEPKAPPGANVTHGICEKCFAQEDKKISATPAAAKPGTVIGPNGEVWDLDDDDQYVTMFKARKESRSLQEIMGCMAGCDCDKCAQEDYDPETVIDQMIPSDEEELQSRTRIVGRDSLLDV